jgi:hypothetical protein
VRDQIVGSLVWEEEPSNEQGAVTLSASVTDCDIADVRPLFGEGTA